MAVPISGGSVFRLRRQIDPVVVQPAADEHRQVGRRRSPGSQRLPQDAQSLHAGQRVLHGDTLPRQFPVGVPMAPVQRPLTRFLTRRADARGPGLAALESAVAQQTHRIVQPEAGAIGFRFVMPPACDRRRQQHDAPTGRGHHILTVVRLRRPL